MAQRRWRMVCWLVLLAVADLLGKTRSRAVAPIVFSQSFVVSGSRFQIDFGQGSLELPRSDVVERIRRVAENVARFYGRFPVSRVRVVVLPVEGEHGVLQGTTWGDRVGFPALVRIRLGSSTTREELTGDWVMTHELVHTAFSSLPDDEHWLEEGLASYVEPVARVQAGEMSVEEMWGGMVKGMPNGEPESRDHGLNNTHTWGRTYWGGALFCLMADVQIRRETQNLMGLQDALRAIVAAGATIDTEMPVDKVLAIGDQATGTHVLERMYVKWGGSPVAVDLPKLWEQLGVRDTRGRVTLSGAAPLSAIRIAITASVPPSDGKGSANGAHANKLSVDKKRCNLTSRRSSNEAVRYE